MDHRILDLIFHLLRVSLFGESVDSKSFTTLSEGEWKEIYYISTQHGVVAIAWDAIVALAGKKVIAPDGQVFDSRKEFRRWCELRLLERAGKISGLMRQVKFELIPPQMEVYERISEKTGRRLQDGHRCVEQAVNYIADFVYTDSEGIEVVEDVKANEWFQDPVYKLKKKLMYMIHHIKIKEIY